MDFPRSGKEHETLTQRVWIHVLTVLFSNLGTFLSLGFIVCNLRLKVSTLQSLFKIAKMRVHKSALQTIDCNTHFRNPFFLFCDSLGKENLELLLIWTTGKYVSISEPNKLSTVVFKKAKVFFVQFFFCTRQILTRSPAVQRSTLGLPFIQDWDRLWACVLCWHLLLCTCLSLAFSLPFIPGISTTLPSDPLDYSTCSPAPCD